MHVLNPAPDTVRSLANRVFAGRGACVTRGEGAELATMMHVKIGP